MSLSLKLTQPSARSARYTNLLNSKSSKNAFNIKTSLQQPNKTQTDHSTKVLFQGQQEILKEAAIQENKELKMKNYQQLQIITLQKTKLQQLRDENMKLCDKFLNMQEETLQQIKDQDMCQKVLMIQSLRKSNQTFTEDHRKLKLELEFYKKQPIFTKNMELKTENTLLQEEMSRLKVIIELKNNGGCNEEKYQELQDNYTALANEHLVLKNDFLKQKTLFQKTKNELQKYKIDQSHEEHIIEKLTSSSKLYKQTQQKAIDLKQQLLTSKSYTDELIEQLNSKLTQVKNLEKQCLMYANLQSEYDTEKKDHMILQKMFEKLSKENKDLLTKINNTPVEQHHHKIPQRLNIATENKNYLKGQQKQVAEVHYKDIEFVVKKLICRLKASHTPLEQVLSYVVTQGQEEEEIKEIAIFEMMHILQAHPFDLDGSECELVARYLVEPEEKDKSYVLDYEISCQIEVVKSVLRKLLENYVLLTQEEYQQATEQVLRVVIGSKASINDQLLKHKTLEDLLHYRDIMILLERQKVKKSLLEVLTQHIYVMGEGSISEFKANDFFEYWHHIGQLEQVPIQQQHKEPIQVHDQ